MKDLAIVITIAYFALYGAISIVGERVEAQELTNFCELEDVFCYGEPISEVETTRTMPVEAKPSIMDTFKKVCEKKGISERFCWEDLYKIMQVESGGNGKAIGDNGRARGFFQIWYKLHNITIDQAEDLNFSANWTLQHLLDNGYPVYRTWAIGAHNSRTPYHNKLYSSAVSRVPIDKHILKGIE